MLAIVNYGVGNLFSLSHSFEAIGVPAEVTSDPDVLKRADRIVLPGVGAFEDAAAKLRASGMQGTLLEQARAGKPLLGICLGMQMLFEKSYEYGEHEGLGLIEGAVKPIAPRIPADYKIPHIGWNALHKTRDTGLLAAVGEGDFVYFVHSFHAEDCEAATIATTEYGGTLTAAVAKANVMGCQFHPEKSGAVGLRILKAFAETEAGLC